MLLALSGDACPNTHVTMNEVLRPSWQADHPAIPASSGSLASLPAEVKGRVEIAVAQPGKYMWQHSFPALKTQHTARQPFARLGKQQPAAFFWGAVVHSFKEGGTVGFLRCMPAVHRIKTFFNHCIVHYVFLCPRAVPVLLKNNR